MHFKCGLNAFYWHQIFTLDSDIVKYDSLTAVTGGFDCPPGANRVDGTSCLDG